MSDDGAHTSLQDADISYEDGLENDELDEESSADDGEGHFFKEGQRSEFNKFRQMSTERHSLKK